MSKASGDTSSGPNFFEKFNRVLNSLDSNFSIKVLDCRRGDKDEMELNVIEGRKEFLGNAYYYLSLEVSHAQRRMVSILRFHLTNGREVEEIYADIVGPIDLVDKSELTDPIKRQQFDQMIGRTQRFLQGPLVKEIEDWISGKTG